MGTVVRLYLGWRLFRFLRPLLGLAVLAGVVLVLQAHRPVLNGSAARALRGGAAAGLRDLSQALDRGFSGPRR
jgi:hypothetical protein